MAGPNIGRILSLAAAVMFILLRQATTHLCSILAGSRYVPYLPVLKEHWIGIPPSTTMARGHLEFHGTRTIDSGPKWADVCMAASPVFLTNDLDDRANPKVELICCTFEGP